MVLRQARGRARVRPGGRAHSVVCRVGTCELHWQPTPGSVDIRRMTDLELVTRPRTTPQNQTELAAQPAVAASPRQFAPDPAPRQGPQPVAPTAEQLTGGTKPVLKGASSAVLMTAASAYSEATFRQFHDQLAATISTLSEPSRTPEPTRFARLCEFLAGQLASLVVARTGIGFLAAVKATFGELGAEPLKQLVKDSGKAVTGAMAAGAVGIPADRQGGQDAGTWVNPAAGSLLEEFKARQFNHLTVAEADAKVTLAMMTEYLAHYPRHELEALAVTLQASARSEHNPARAAFSEQLTVGWLNVLATLSLGPKASARAPDMPGANEPSGLGMGVRGEEIVDQRKWRDGHDGFVEIFVDLPETILLTAGLRLVSASVGAGGPAELLRRMRTPLNALATYRRVWFQVAGDGRMSADPAFVITPEGTIEADGGNGVLEAIGSALPWNARDVHYDGSDEDIEVTRRTEPIVDTLPDFYRREELRSRLAARAGRAVTGAQLVADWLGTHSSERIK